MTPVALASYVTCPAVEVGDGIGTSVKVSGPSAGSTVHRKLSLATLTPSLTETTTLKLPAAVGVPLMRPVAALIARPVGRPVAV